MGNLGLFLSLRLRFTSQAWFSLFGTLIAIVVTLSIVTYFEPYNGPSENWEHYRGAGAGTEDWLGPIQSWWYLLRPNSSYFASRSDSRDSIGYVVATIAYSGIGSYFFLLSTRLVPRKRAPKQ